MEILIFFGENQNENTFTMEKKPIKVILENVIILKNDS